MRGAEEDTVPGVALKLQSSAASDGTDPERVSVRFHTVTLMLRSLTSLGSDRLFLFLMFWVVELSYSWVLMLFLVFGQRFYLQF